MNRLPRCPLCGGDCKTCCEFLSRDDDYQKLVKKAREFADVLSGEAGFERPDINRIALESMLVGWLTLTPMWRAYELHCRKNHPRENIYLLAQDHALQAAQDAVGDHYRFEDFETGTSLIRDTVLARRIAASGVRVGIAMGMREIAHLRARAVCVNRAKRSLRRGK